jgi:hypothetical protein
MASSVAIPRDRCATTERTCAEFTAVRARFTAVHERCGYWSDGCGGRIPFCTECVTREFAPDAHASVLPGDGLSFSVAPVRSVKPVLTASVRPPTPRVGVKSRTAFDMLRETSRSTNRMLAMAPPRT